MDDLTNSLLVLSIVFWIYMAPSGVAFIRKVPSPWSIVVINALLGWTLIGWAVALAMAVRDRKPAEPKPDATAGVQQLAELRAQGLLTDDEFSAAKGRLLG